MGKKQDWNLPGSVIDNPPRSLLDFNESRGRIMDRIPELHTADAEQAFNERNPKQVFTVAGKFKTRVFSVNGVEIKAVRDLREVTTRKRAHWWSFL